MLKMSILDMNFKIMNLRSQPHLPGANELNITLVTHSPLEKKKKKKKGKEKTKKKKKKK